MRFPQYIKEQRKEASVWLFKKPMNMNTKNQRQLSEYDSTELECNSIGVEHNVNGLNSKHDLKVTKSKNFFFSEANTRLDNDQKNR